MKLKIFLVLILLFCSACAVNRFDDQATIATLVAATRTAQVSTPGPLETQLPVSTQTPEIQTLPIMTYNDPELGYAFDYPADWKIAYQENQSRGYYFQFTRADYMPDPESGGLPAEEILLQVALYNWDPKSDLEAYLDQRFQAWDSSGISAVMEQSWTRPDGEPAVMLLIEGADGDQARIIYTVVGDRYLELSTDSEFDQLGNIAESLRGANR
jgi:hypothetical protein